MAIVKRTVTACICERCGHDWQPKESKTPAICPRCKSPYWNQKKEAQKSGRSSR